MAMYTLSNGTQVERPDVGDALFGPFPFHHIDWCVSTGPFNAPGCTCPDSDADKTWEPEHTCAYDALGDCVAW